MKKRLLLLATLTIMTSGCETSKTQCRKVSVEILAHSHEPYGMVLRPYQCQSELIAKSDDASDFIVDFMVAVRNETGQSIAFPVEHSSFGYTNMTIMISTDRRRVVRLEKRPCIWTKNILECVKVLAGEQVLIPVSLDRRLWENMPQMDVGDKMFVKALLAVELLSKSDDEESLLCIESNWKGLSYRETNTFSPWCKKRTGL